MIDTWTLVCLLVIVAFGGGLAGLFIGHVHATQEANERESALRAEFAAEERDHADRWLAYVGDAYLAGPNFVRPLPDLTHELRPTRNES